MEWSDDLEAPLSPIPAEWKEAKLSDRIAPELRDPEEEAPAFVPAIPRKSGGQLSSSGTLNQASSENQGPLILRVDSSGYKETGRLDMENVDMLRVRQEVGPSLASST